MTYLLAEAVTTTSRSEMSWPAAICTICGYLLLGWIAWLFFGKNS